MKIIVILSAILLMVCSCDAIKSIYNPKSDLENYRCTKLQLGLVNLEYEICSKSGYTDSFCFLTAKISTCEYIYKPENP